jgi:hypothetical protein
MTWSRQGVAGALTILVLLAGGLTVVAGAPPAGAATFTVTNLDDGAVAPAGSLRKAIEDAAASDADATIVVDPSLAGHTINLTAGQLVFTPASFAASLTIEGNRVIVHQSTVSSRVLLAGTAGQLTFVSVTVSGGRAAAGTFGGGAVEAFGPVVVNDSTFTDNVASGAVVATGGAIYTHGPSLTAERSTFTDNHATSAVSANGGAIAVVGTPATPAIRVIDTTVTGNSVESPFTSTAGGALFTGGAVELVRSTIAGNSLTATHLGPVLARGGGVASAARVTATNSTISGNTLTRVNADAGDVVTGGGIGVLLVEEPRDATVTLVYSDVVDNAAPAGANVGIVSVAATDDHFVAGPSASDVGATQLDATLAAFGSVVTGPSGGGENCDGFATTDSAGYNFADDDSCAFATATDTQAAGNDPRLGALGANGGPTETRLPASASPLVNAIAPDDCEADGASGITIDQRGRPRPAADDPRCDIGAVEVQWEHEAETVPEPVLLVPTFTG